MQNFEIKAHYPNLEQARKVAEAIDARFEKTYRQVDTYFRIRNGRLKLRELGSDDAQLIYYLRPNQPEVKLSDYQIYPVAEPEHLKAMLSAALGLETVVEKSREVYWYDQVRIHLDQVTDLGTFVEFEGVVSDEGKKDEIRAKVKWLTTKFKIATADLIGVSYLDMATRMPQSVAAANSVSGAAI